MGFKPEPILDVARGLSAFTAAYILGNQVLVTMKELFEDRCAHCKGAGRLLCPHCGGTNTMRRRPGEFQLMQADVVDHRPADLYQCMHCGPMTVYDLVKEAKDEEDDALDVMENLQDAYAGKLRRHRMPVVAGTVPCPTCYNMPRVRRHTPNFARVFRMEDPWWYAIANRQGWFRFNRPSPIRAREFIEYPSRKPHERDLDPEHIVDSYRAEYEATVADAAELEHKPAWVEDLELLEMAPKERSGEEAQREQLLSRGSAWSGRGALDVADFRLKAVDDSDSEADD